MKKVIWILIVSLLLIGCQSVKKSENTIQRIEDISQVIDPYYKNELDNFLKNNTENYSYIVKNPLNYEKIAFSFYYYDLDKWTKKHSSEFNIDSKDFNITFGISQKYHTVSLLINSNKILHQRNEIMTLNNSNLLDIDAVDKAYIEYKELPIIAIKNKSENQNPPNINDFQKKLDNIDDEYCIITIQLKK